MIEYILLCHHKNTTPSVELAFGNDHILTMIGFIGKSPILALNHLSSEAPAIPPDIHWLPASLI
jgi:hypothetical protein